MALEPGPEFETGGLEPYPEFLDGYRGFSAQEPGPEFMDGGIEPGPEFLSRYGRGPEEFSSLVSFDGYGRFGMQSFNTAGTDCPVTGATQDGWCDCMYQAGSTNNTNCKKKFDLFGCPLCVAAPWTDVGRGARNLPGFSLTSFIAPTVIGAAGGILGGGGPAAAGGPIVPAAGMPGSPGYVVPGSLAATFKKIGPTGLVIGGVAVAIGAGLLFRKLRK